MTLKSILSSLCIGLVLASNLQAVEAPAISPFLITSKGMPHLTGLVKKNWDNEELNLTEDQKGKLLLIRIDTMKNVKRIKPQVVELEEKIKMLTMQGEEAKKLYEMVNHLANLKAEATKVHINCIINTKNILTKEQIKFLTKD